MLKSILRNKFFRVVLCFVAIAMIIVVINFVTYKPFMFLFKGLMNKVDMQGNMGPWEEVIEEVNLLGTESIPVDGYPASKVFLYGGDNAERKPLIVYIHGGGWSTGSAESVSWYAKLLASNGYIVANVDYSLAPEYKYPASTIQLVETVNYLYENADKYGYDNNCIFIAGNSAGAHLSSQLGAIFTNDKYTNLLNAECRVPAKSIRGLILYNGVYNFDTVGECGFPFFGNLAWSYTGVKEYNKYDRIDELSVIKHIGDNYPPVFITVGDTDPLEPQTLEFIEELKNKSLNYQSLLWTGTKSNLWHDYIYEQNTEEAVKAYEETIEFISKYQ